MRQATDNAHSIGFLMLVKKPELYNRALKYIYPNVTDTPGNEAMERLKEFLNDNFDDSIKSELLIYNDKIPYDNIFQSLFL